jgi:hypothetical protein
MKIRQGGIFTMDTDLALFDLQMPEIDGLGVVYGWYPRLSKDEPKKNSEKGQIFLYFTTL